MGLWGPSLISRGLLARKQRRDLSACMNHRLGQVISRVNKRVRIAVHGTNGFPPQLMRKCIEAGVSKINVNKDMLDEYYAHLRAETSTKKPHTILIEEGVEKVMFRTIGWMEEIGSAGKAFPA